MICFGLVKFVLFEDFHYPFLYYIIDIIYCMAINNYCNFIFGVICYKKSFVKGVLICHQKL